MLPERDRHLLERVLSATLDGIAHTEWATPGDGWSARVRLASLAGRHGELLTSPEWQEARFADPRCSVFILTSTDEDDVREALTKLARAMAEYLRGGGDVENERGILGSKSVLVLRTVDGEWRIGPRTAHHP